MDNARIASGAIIAVNRAGVPQPCHELVTFAS
jgi:hypothetical protein